MSQNAASDTVTMTKGMACNNGNRAQQHFLADPVGAIFERGS